MEKSKLINLIEDIYRIAKKESWQVKYDADLDYFYWTKPKLSKSARLVQIFEEFAMYMTPRGAIEGIFIEYARNNFLEHNPKFKPLFKLIDKKVGDDIFTVSAKNKKDTEHYLDDLAIKIENQALREEHLPDLKDLTKALAKTR